MHVLYFCGSFAKGEGGFLNGREKNDTQVMLGWAVKRRY